MNKYHQEILGEIKKTAPEFRDTTMKGKVNLSNYLGTSKPMYDLTNPQTRVIAKTWVKNNQSISLKDFVELLDSLYAGKTHTERTFGGFLLEYSSTLRKQIDPNLIKQWLTGAEGWLEVDSLCQSNFSSKEVLENWKSWEKLIKELSIDQDVHKRRASLVLFCKSVGESDDKRLADLAFANIDKLKLEKDILITKAISWLLRNLIQNHRQRVEDFLKENKDVLPKIAVREVFKKLLTGKK